MKRFFKGNGFAVVLMIVLVLMAVINGNFLSDPLGWFLNVLYMMPGIVIGITVHEFAHAFVAYKLGDVTPKREKRVTLNPISHIEPLGFFALFLIGFGWGRPVPVNPYAFKHRRRDNILVDVAGITTNLILAIFFMGLAKLCSLWLPDVMSSGGIDIVFDVIQYAVWINLVLMVFNLLPVPPLDGFGIVTEVFDLRGQPIYEKIYNAGFPILLFLIILNLPSKIVRPVISFIYDILLKVFFGV
jgi:Zn-dependent protease